MAPDADPVKAPAGAALLPGELDPFLNGSVCRTVTVRGEPGVGKTTFGLGVLRAFRGHRTFLTTRVPLDVLRQQFAWLDEPAEPPIAMIEFLRFRSLPATGVLSVDHLRQTLQARASDLVDISQVMTLPPVLSDRLTSLPPGPSLVVIDSWEAWVENVLGSSSINLDAPTTRWELERSMLDQILATGAHVMMVTERDQRTRFDYIVDGSLLLASGEVEGREERWIEISKLRGARIRNRSYPFTLEEARFRILRASPWDGTRPARAEPDPQPTNPALWPGASAFAASFGRLPPHGPLLIDVDAETPVRLAWELTLPMIESAVSAGGRVVVRPPVLLDPKEVWASLAAFRPPAELVRSVRLTPPPGGLPPGEVPPEAYLSPGEPAAAPAVPSGTAPAVPSAELSAGGRQALEFLRGGDGALGRNLAVIFPLPWEAVDARGGIDEYLRLLVQARYAGLAFSSTVVLPQADPILGLLRSRAQLHLSLRTRRGQAFLYGVRPWTPALLVDRSAADPSRSGPYVLRQMI